MENERLKIFVSAYACEPNLGSEKGVGWHWILEMNKYFEIWAMTRADHERDITKWMKDHPQDHDIHFVYYDMPKWARFWKRGMRGVHLYYLLWQQLSNRLVKKTMLENNIQIFHLLTWGNALWPISSYGQKKFFIWGPTGGIDTIPAEYSCHYHWRDRMQEAIRRFTIRSLKFNPVFQRQCKNADLILCKASSIYYAIKPCYRQKAKLFTDVAVEMKDVDQMTSQASTNPKIKCIVVGQLDAWRGFDILLEAFAIAKKEIPVLHLDIIGKGSDGKRISQMIDRLRLKDSVSMVGKVSMDEYLQRMADCDIVLNPSLKEGAVTVAFDSMAFSKPLICIETGGYTNYFNNEYAIVLERKSRKETINNLVSALLRLKDKSERNRLGSLSHNKGKEFTWEHKGYAIRDAILNAWNNGNETI